MGAVEGVWTNWGEEKWEVVGFVGGKFGERGLEERERAQGCDKLQERSGLRSSPCASAPDAPLTFIRHRGAEGAQIARQRLAPGTTLHADEATH